ncbi:MAG: glycerophosphodiester phosphodiesterase [Myxococcota bacterium]|nr:glycerophosphodiester phosphodiesterase [Myxococcota bacterium]
MLLSSCAQKVPIPSFDEDSLLSEATPMEPASLRQLEGRWTLQSDDADAFWGDSLSLVVRQGGISLFTPHNAYALLDAGCLESGELVLEGYWREAPSTRTGLLQLFVRGDAAAQLCAGALLDERARTEMRLEGWHDERGEDGQHSIEWGDWRPKREMPRFFILAHRGGCRSSDYCGASENSLEVIKLAARFGADAVEVDVLSTADGVPILFHDLAFSARLVNGPYCYGPVSEFTLAHVRALCTLEQGERVPTLEEALDTIIDETELGGVWLDIKDARSMQAAIDLGEQARQRAESQGRALSLVYGLYSEEMMDAYRAAIKPDGASCLVELGRKDAIELGCQVWAPRWTRGSMPDKVSEAQQDGLVVAFWTLDETDFIDHFLQDSKPNALLTNRPWLVFERYQRLGESPPGPEPFPFP